MTEVQAFSQSYANGVARALCATDFFSSALVVVHRENFLAPAIEAIRVIRNPLPDDSFSMDHFARLTESRLRQAALSAALTSLKGQDGDAFAADLEKKGHRSPVAYGSRFRGAIPVSIHTAQNLAVTTIASRPEQPLAYKLTREAVRSGDQGKRPLTESTIGLLLMQTFAQAYETVRDSDRGLEDFGGMVEASLYAGTENLPAIIACQAVGIKDSETAFDVVTQKVAAVCATGLPSSPANAEKSSVQVSNIMGARPAILTIGHALYARSIPMVLGCCGLSKGEADCQVLEEGVRLFNEIAAEDGLFTLALVDSLPPLTN